MFHFPIIILTRKAYRRRLDVKWQEGYDDGYTDAKSLYDIPDVECCEPAKSPDKKTADSAAKGNKYGWDQGKGQSKGKKKGHGK